MFTAAEFRQFAEECIESARAAKTDAKRKHTLDLAKMWTKAAAQMDGGSMIPPLPSEAAHD